MSQPVKICTIIKAAKGDQQAFDWLVNVMERNVRHGAFTLYPCDHKPPCEKPTEEQMEALNRRMELVMRERSKQKQQKQR